VDRKTVRRIVDRKKVHLERGRITRTSLLEPYRDEIKKLLIKDPTIAASTILHRIRETGYMGGLTILRDHVRELKIKGSPRLKVNRR